MILQKNINDPALGVTYDLHVYLFEEIRELARSWYQDIDFKDFDKRNSEYERDKDFFSIIKQTGATTNFIYAYNDNGQMLLLDGFNRLLTDYGLIDLKQPIYVKIIQNTMHDHHIMRTLLLLNLWKISERSQQGGFSTENFLDRGLRLFMYKKWGIELYKHQRDKDGEWGDRKKHTSDFDALDNYFNHEHDFAGYFRHDFGDLLKIFSNPRIIDDFKEILLANNKKTLPFENYDKFLAGYTMFVSEQRRKGSEEYFFFNDWLKKLKNDKKFFNKLPKYSWTDRTRQAIYKWYREQV